MLIFVAILLLGPRLRLAEGGAHVALTADRATGRTRRPRRRARDHRLRASSTVPIVVPNTLWRAADPEAYDGGRESDITHLREFEASGPAAATTRAGAASLEVIPTKADYVLDLIRVNSLWPLLSGLACCAIEMMSRGDLEERHGPLGHVPVPRQPAPGGRPDRRRAP